MKLIQCHVSTYYFLSETYQTDNGQVTGTGTEDRDGNGKVPPVPDDI